MLSVNRSPLTVIRYSLFVIRNRLSAVHNLRSAVNGQRSTDNGQRITDNGFTLIELLVVISIIGILVAISSVSYLTAQKKGRDGRRRQDLKAIQNALEQYYAENQVYPITDNQINTAFSSGTRPQDPKNTGDYTYNWNYLSTDGYCICAKLEATKGNANAPSSINCSWNSGGNYLCIQSQQ